MHLQFYLLASCTRAVLLLGRPHAAHAGMFAAGHMKGTCTDASCRAEDTHGIALLTRAGSCPSQLSSPPTRAERPRRR